jgi:hypothetical protein
LKFEEKKKLFTFQVPGSDNYPPHLALVPTTAESAISFLDIFNFMRLLGTGVLLFQMIPDKILEFINDNPIATTMAGMEARNQQIRLADVNIGTEANIGDRTDWYTDAVFAQQQFTGPNPTTITKASPDWVERFKTQARDQQKQALLDLLDAVNPDSLYLQDYSFFRDAVGAKPEDILCSDDRTRFACASVCLFHLNPDGKLHPLAIVLDYRGTMEKSVVAFNQRLQPLDSSHVEGTDWTWRYAKMCVQVSDWNLHELTVHLTETHLVEEAVIVAAHRKLPIDHIVYRLLAPHWLKTLPLNAAARSALIPSFFVNINGMTSSQTYAFIKDAYNKFDWKARYIPNDLQTRGFPESELGSKKFHNYAYGRNMSALWQKLCVFVSSVITRHYTTNAEVERDQDLQNFCNEMRNPLGAAMDKFPDINTIEEVIDMVVMCIHIASPQHTAVNYLQDYYQAFVPNKPSCLCTPLPQTIERLNTYTEEDLVQALPVKHPRVWLMASHLPYLLSYQVDQKQTLLNYALSLQKLAESTPGDQIYDAGKQLVDDLVSLKAEFGRNKAEMDDQLVPYNVMDPDATAVSILL